MTEHVAEYLIDGRKLMVRTVTIDGCATTSYWYAPGEQWKKVSSEGEPR